MTLSESLDIISVVGARPQFVKLAPVARELEKVRFVTHQIIHTGQHYDDRMSTVFFEQLNLPKPDINLGVGSASHGAQTGAMLVKLEAALLERRPDALIVYGDTNSTLAATLAATKIHIPVAHIEAGLRSFNRGMPEEINRLVADHCGDRLYAPTPAAMKNLSHENLAHRALWTGDVMRDAVLHNQALARKESRILNSMGLEPGAFGLLTIHRPVNTTAKVLQELLAVLSEIGKSTIPFLFPIHPRTRAVMEEANHAEFTGLRLIEPVSYLDMLCLIEAAAVAVTDSGGVQKEAAFLGTPCVSLREETEWTETVELGVNCLVGSDPVRIKEALGRVINSSSPFDDTIVQDIRRIYGNGDAAEVIARDVIAWLEEPANIK